MSSIAEKKLQPYDLDTRAQFEDGDVLLWRGNFLSSKLFQRLTDSYYSHVALVAKWSDRVMVLQAQQRGVVAVPLSKTIAKYPGRVDWYGLRRQTRSAQVGGVVEEAPSGALPLPTEDAVRQAISNAQADLGVGYGWGSLLLNVWAWLFQVRLRDSGLHPMGMFCSEYVQHCFSEAGIPLVDRADIVTFPKHIAQSQLLEYRGTLKPDPDAPPLPRQRDVVRKARPRARASAANRPPCSRAALSDSPTASREARPGATTPVRTRRPARVAAARYTPSR
jgi:hypothetical protein